MRAAVIICLLSVFLASCAVSEFPGKPIPMSELSIGMTKAQVEESLGKPYTIVGLRQYDHATMEVWSYRKYSWDRYQYYLVEEYWIYFLNGRVEGWGPAGEWVVEADRIYKRWIGNKQRQGK